MMEHGLLKDFIDHSLKNPIKQTALVLDIVEDAGVWTIIKVKTQQEKIV